jgi:uncharacterized damage-inducible protein DinB
MLVAMPQSAGTGPATDRSHRRDPEADLPERQFGWWDMFVHPADDPREQGDEVTSERDVLVRFLRDYRLTLELKCDGLDAGAMAHRSVPPSNLSLLGLVRHLAGVEHYWFKIVLAGTGEPRLYRSEGEPNGDFTGAAADPDLVDEAWRTWRSEVAFAEQLVDEAPDLEFCGTFPGGEYASGAISLREIMVHMIEEYARHMGHADFLRERIDGRVGQ